jgi:hypothetical protein
VIVPYATGETPVLGDYVKNKFEQPGTVVEISTPPMSVGGEELVSVKWDDGGRDLSLTPAAEFLLISREASP